MRASRADSAACAAAAVATSAAAGLETNVYNAMYGRYGLGWFPDPWVQQ
jgi:hypothetical protein